MCALAIGAQGHLGIRKESSFASGGSIDSWQPFNSETIGLTYNNVYSDRIQSTAEQVGGQSGIYVVAGNITFPVSPQMPSQWLTCGVGQTSSPYYPTRDLSSMLFQIDRETAAVQVSGCMIGTMAFSSSQGGELTCSVDTEGAGMGSVTAGSPSFIASDSPYLHEEATFALNGANDTSVTAWSLNVNNNLVGDLFGTSRARLNIPAGKCVVTGSFTKLFDDTTERNAFLNAQVRSFKATFARQGASIVFLCPKVRYNTHPENIGGQSEYILETFNFTAFVDDPSTENSLRITGDFVL